MGSSSVLTVEVFTVLVSYGGVWLGCCSENASPYVSYRRKDLTFWHGLGNVYFGPDS